MKKYDDSFYLHEDINPSWINSQRVEEHFEGGLKEIFLFFVVFCPCKQYATQKRTLDYYNWKQKPWSPSSYLKNSLDDAATKSFKKNTKIEAWHELKKTWNSFNFDNLNWYMTSSELAICSKVEDSNYMSIFYHIRCALAHGRFLIETKNNQNYFAFENGIQKGKRFFVKARIVLKESTLLEWIKIIKQGPQQTENNDANNDTFKNIGE